MKKNKKLVLPNLKKIKADVYYYSTKKRYLVFNKDRRLVVANFLSVEMRIALLYVMDKMNNI